MARQVAHEIKNPLTPIKLAVQHLRRAFFDRRSDFDQILDRNVESILREIDRLSEISRAFSRFGSPGAPESPLEAVDVPRVVDEVLALYGGAEGGAAFRAEISDRRVPLAIARTDELKEVLLNLLENAREAVDGSGEVVVSSAHDAAANRLSVAVQDNGVGIPQDQLPSIFEPHFSTRSSGTGLGLAIVRRIVDSWGGEIEAESEPGRGSRFTIRLRIAREPGDSEWSAEERRLRPLPPVGPFHVNQDQETTMSELKRGQQSGGGRSSGGSDPVEPGSEEQNRQGEFGTAERGTRGTDRDADAAGRSKNQAHGHPDEEGGASGEGADR
jgi:signal transduction histidine kinase